MSMFSPRVGRTAVYVGGIAAASFCAFMFLIAPAEADYTLQYVSDLISTSNPATSTNHTVTFRVPSAVPPGGRIIITPEDGAFTVPDTLDYADVDLATSSALTGTYADRTLAAASSALADGLTVATGTSGSFTFTLQGSQGIATSTFVRVKIGTHTSFGGTGDAMIVNPTSTASQSYRIYIRTEDAGQTLIDDGATYVAILPAVSLAADTFDFDPPVRTNGMPTGTIPAGIRQVEVSLNTDEYATCRYATTTGVTYDLMTNTFSFTGTSVHITVVSTTADNTTYSFYVRCVDNIPNENTDDYPIIFTLAPTPLPPGTGGPSPSPGGGGGSAPFPPPAQPPSPHLSLSGIAYPLAAVTILKDGAVYKELSAAGNGSFSLTAGEIPQGTYTFSTYATDSAGRRSSAYTTTFTIVRGTRNSITGILVPPTIALDVDTVSPGGTATVRGKTAPGAPVEVQISRQTKGPALPSEVAVLTASSTPSGDWTADLSTRSFAEATYLIRARATIPGVGTTPMSQTAYLGVGRSPNAGACPRSDMNFDGKVNLVDFSILLFHWGTANEIADLNTDGKVNLTDFSILLFCWTG